MNPMPAAVTVSTGAMVLRVVLALALVLGVFAAVLFLYRRAARGSAMPRRGQRIEILAQRSVGTRTSLALVRVAGEATLIGITPQQITSLGSVSLETDEEAMRVLLGASPEGQASSPKPAVPSLPVTPRADPGLPGSHARAIREQLPAIRSLPDDDRFAHALQRELARVRVRLAAQGEPADGAQAAARVEA